MVTENLQNKLAKAQELTRSLDKSLAMEWLWPEVFEHGRVRAYWRGVSPKNQDPRTPVHKYHEYVITNGEEEQRSFSFEQVPEILGGGLKREAYRRFPKVTEST